jgi:hypothetical protein
VHHQVFCENSKNECLDTVDVLATAQMKEETTSCLIALGTGASTTLRTSDHTDWRMMMMMVHLDQFVPYKGATRDNQL